VNCAELPAAAWLLVGLTVIEVRTTGTTGITLTVSVVVLEIALSCASIVVLPGRIAVARPAGLMIAISEFEEDHVTMPETS
jgi:hypothetical protein